MSDLLEMDDDELRKLCVDRRVNITARRQIRKNAKILRARHEYDKSRPGAENGNFKTHLVQTYSGQATEENSFVTSMSQQEQGLREAEEALRNGQ